VSCLLRSVSATADPCARPAPESRRDVLGARSDTQPPPSRPPITTCSQGRCQLNATDTHGRSAVYHAASSGEGEGALRLLLAAGADFMAEGLRGRTPRQAAHHKGHEPCVRLLEVSLRLLRATHNCWGS
jgi:hypothetical protein